MKLPSLKIIFLTLAFFLGSALIYTMSPFSTVITDSKAEEEFLRTDHLRLQTARSGDPLAQVEGFIIILITSAPWNTKQRQAIRQTWLSSLTNNSIALGRSNIRAMKDPINAFNTLVIHYWFVCGHDKKNNVELSLENETQNYGDILRLNYTEKYSLLVQKTLSSLRFASTMDVKFIVKVDDDVYLHISRMIWWLKTAPLPEKLYAGQVLHRSRVIRHRRSKWYVGKQYFNDTYYPPYCNGPFYILSKNVVLELLQVSFGDRLSSFPIEDAYIGILAKRIGIKPVDLMRKSVFIHGKVPKAVDYQLNKFFALGHALTAQRLFAIYKRFLKLPLIMPSEI